jgi:hypothetical protein
VLLLGSVLRALGHLAEAVCVRMHKRLGVFWAELAGSGLFGACMTIICSARVVQIHTTGILKRVTLYGLAILDALRMRCYL